MESHESDSVELTRLVARPVGRTAAHQRRWAALVFLGCTGILGLAAWLKPDPRGYGTHQQLGFGKCGMLVTTGLPCPTCGMTTAFAHVVRGQLIRGFLAQPAGFLLAVGTVVCALGASWVLVTGHMPPIRIPVLTPYRLFFGLLILLVGSWAFKIVLGLATGTLPDR